MAKSNSFFSIRRGSTKSHTFSSWQGRQVTKDRVINVRNPRSVAQQSQRMKFAAVGNFYKYLKFILNHSWEGVSYGVNSYSKYMSLNVKNFKTASMIIPEYGSKVAEAGTYQVSEGTLQAPVTAYDDEDFAFRFLVRSSEAGKLLLSDIRSQMFVGDPDYITFVGLYSTVEPDGSPAVSYQTKGFAVRLHNPSEAGSTEVTSDNWKTLFNPEFINITEEQFGVVIDTSNPEAMGTLTISAGKSEGEYAIDTSIYMLSYGAIASKKEDGLWKRSTAVLANTPDLQALVAPTNASNAESWPVGADYILNGEATAVLD